jgi:hypothetical protein
MVKASCALDCTPPPPVTDLRQRYFNSIGVRRFILLARHYFDDLI